MPKTTVAGRAVPKRRHIPIPGTCEYVTVHSRQYFADVIRVMNPNREIILNYPGKSNVIT